MSAAATFTDPIGELLDAGYRLRDVLQAVAGEPADRPLDAAIARDVTDRIGAWERAAALWALEQDEPRGSHAR